MSVSANVLGDFYTKIMAFPEFAKEMGEHTDGEGLTEFITELQGRILYGGLKYGPGSWKRVDLMAELKQELYDVAGYAFLETLKRGDKLHWMEREWLVSLAVSAFFLWQEVSDDGS